MHISAVIFTKVWFCVVQKNDYKEKFYESQKQKTVSDCNKHNCMDFVSTVISFCLQLFEQYILAHPGQSFGWPLFDDGSLLGILSDYRVIPKRRIVSPGSQMLVI